MAMELSLSPAPALVTSKSSFSGAPLSFLRPPPPLLSPVLHSGDGGGAGIFSRTLRAFASLFIEVPSGFAEIIDQILLILREARSWVVAPLLRVAVAVCLTISVMMLVDFAAMGAVSLAVRIFRLRPEKRYKWEPISGDPETGGGDFPMVLVQIPMYNEIEVYKLSIAAACELTWPSDRLIIQVLDDSTDPTVRDLVQLECQLWASKGVGIKYEVRENRVGYKAGALKKGMEHSYTQQCDFVAIFDADFQPEPDFLTRTIPFLVHNSKIALVQARWEFVNYSECMMTRIQKMTLDYHFMVEQEAGSATVAFFGFNGTAGVWRISAINEVGGWKDRTTVEDMDMAVRATLKGWKLLYVGEVQVKSELPITFKAYCRQQHRWTCGPAQLFRKMALDILMSKDIPVWKKFYLLYCFFSVRKIVTHLLTFTLYCIVIPLSVMVPEVVIPIWGVTYVPMTILFLNAVGHLRSIHIIPFWMFFENVMSLHRMKATLVGLFEIKGVNEWIVTKKLGDTRKRKIETQILEKPPVKLRERLNLSELSFSVFLFLCASYDLLYGNYHRYTFIYLQAISFLLVGCGYVGISQA